MRNKTPFISRSGQRAACLGGFDWSCHWSPWAWPAPESHLDSKLMWGRGQRCQKPAGKTATPSELIRSMDSCEGRTKPGQILDSERWWHLLPRNDFCLQIVIYNSGGRQGEHRRHLCLCFEEAGCHFGRVNFSLTPPGLVGTFNAQQHASHALSLLRNMRWEIPTPHINYNSHINAHDSIRDAVD